MCLRSTVSCDRQRPGLLPPAVGTGQSGAVRALPGAGSIDRHPTRRGHASHPSRGAWPSVSATREQRKPPSTSSNLCPIPYAPQGVLHQADDGGIAGIVGRLLQAEPAVGRPLGDIRAEVDLIGEPLSPGAGGRRLLDGFAPPPACHRPVAGSRHAPFASGAQPQRPGDTGASRDSTPAKLRLLLADAAGADGQAGHGCGGAAARISKADHRDTERGANAQAATINTRSLVRQKVQQNQASRYGPGPSA